MSAYIDPLTAITLANEARADQLRRAAEHRRLREATRATRHDTPNAEGRPVVHHLLTAVRRRAALA